MRKIPDKLVLLFDEMGITTGEAVWDCHGTPVVNHKSLERVAAHLNIGFDEPMVIESDAQTKTVVMLVTGRLGDKVEWSIGEAAPYNNKNGYPYAMAEKRAKDRVILKLIEVSGDVYSNEEAEDFKAEQARLAREATSTQEPQQPADPKPVQEDVGARWLAWCKAQVQHINKARETSQLTRWTHENRDHMRNLKNHSEAKWVRLTGIYNDQYEKLNTGLPPEGETQ